MEAAESKELNPNDGASTWSVGYVASAARILAYRGSHDGHTFVHRMSKGWRFVPLLAVMLVLSVTFSYVGWTKSAATLRWASQNESTKRRLLVQAEQRRLPSSLVSRELQIKGEDDPEQDDSTRRKCAADLLALFGGKAAASSVELSRAKELRACVRRLVPSSPFLGSKSEKLMGDEFLEYKSSRPQSLWSVESPPAAVKQLARSAVEWGGDLNVVMKELESTNYSIPDVERINEDKCSLTKFEYGRRFRNREINEYLTTLFKTIQKLSPTAGLNISLSRYDLFHGHMFTAHDTGRLGILFHAREFPAYDEKRFPLNLGFCQKGSSVPYDNSMTTRNIVWLAPMPDCSKTERKCSEKWLAPGFLFVLDTSASGILGRELVPWYLDIVHTVQEEDLGDLVIDVNYFDSLDGPQVDKLFLC
ncbi:hypothetical protein R1sor_015177 [Riccia sorocarpa]|uniref:Uncharacterized protein n=1 Tax=Riccia sorocarpa TaxID=122646 RepID=A0ABD3HC07_9MARC